MCIGLLIEHQSLKNGMGGDNGSIGALQFLQRLTVFFIEIGGAVSRWEDHVMFHYEGFLGKIEKLLFS